MQLVSSAKLSKNEERPDGSVGMKQRNPPAKASEDQYTLSCRLVVDTHVTTQDTQSYCRRAFEKATLSVSLEWGEKESPS